MAFKIPWSNFHELNLDWVLEKMKALETKVDDYTGSAVPSNDPPLMDGVASVGSSVNYARGDHVHPTDTSRASTSALEGVDGKVDDNYTELKGDINAVDAKIVFATAAPAMDGVASPGSATTMARGDHVHPTDTSRASQTQVDSLQAAVDAWSGAASPYAGTPAMDGTASAGVIDAFSRGDHVHPADTSKLDVAGGEITGSLVVDTESQFIATNTTGWIRVANVPRENGVKLDFTIVRQGTTAPSEVHDISFYINKNYGLGFTNEVSRSDVAYVNGIRYSDAGAIDIHMDQTAESTIGIHLRRYTPSKAIQNATVLTTPAFVADAPDGETILSSFTLHAMTTGLQSVSKFGKTWKFVRKQNMCMLTAPDDIGENVAAGEHSITSLSWTGTGVSFYPVVNDPSGNPGTYVKVNQWGNVSLVTDGLTSGDPCAINGTWILDY